MLHGKWDASELYKSLGNMHYHWVYTHDIKKQAESGTARRDADSRFPLSLAASPTQGVRNSCRWESRSWMTIMMTMIIILGSMVSLQVATFVTHCEDEKSQDHVR